MQSLIEIWLQKSSYGKMSGNIPNLDHIQNVDGYMVLEDGKIIAVTKFFQYIELEIKY